MSHNSEEMQQDIPDETESSTLDIPGLESDDVDKRILLLKCAKAKSKTAFTKLKNKLLGILDSEEEILPSRTLVREVQECMMNAQEHALIVMEKLSSEYSIKEDSELMRKIDDEIEQLEDTSAKANANAI